MPRTCRCQRRQCAAASLILAIALLAARAERVADESFLRSDNGLTFSLLQRKALASANKLDSLSSDFESMKNATSPEIHHVPLGTSLHDYLALETSDMHMNLTNLVHSNLGGHGPDGGAAEMRYENVFPLTSGSVDLVVRALSPYQPKNVDNNGLNGDIGSISMRGGRATTFSFSFADTYDHSKPVTVSQLYFSYFDLDGDKKGTKEEVSTPLFEKVYLSAETTVQIIEGDGAGVPPKFRSTAVDNSGKNNPDDPSSLTDEQLAHSVTFSFVLISEFNVTLATPKGKFNSGRNFMFNGVPLFPKCVNTSETSALTFTDTAYSNLGEAGPDYFFPEGMRLTEIFQFKNGQVIDLLVTSIDEGEFEYKPSRTELNGVRDGFGCINMEVGAQAKFKFEFVDAATNASVRLKNLVFSWLDLDGHPKMPDFQEKITMIGFDDIYVADDTEVKITSLPGGATEFASTEADESGGKTNPTDPGVLTPEQERRAFAVKFSDVSSFIVIIDISSGDRPMPRSLYFHGVTRLNNAEEEEYCK